MRHLPPITGDGRARGLAGIVALAVGQAAAAGVAAFATRDVFAALGGSATDLPVLALASIAAAGLMIAVLRYSERVVAERVGQDYVAALRLLLFRHLTRVSARDLAERRNGALSLRFVGDLSVVRGWVSLGLARLISALIVLPAATGVLFLLNPSLGIAAAVPIVLGLLLMALFGRQLGPAHRRLRKRRARLAADMSERVPHAPELRLLGRVSTETRHLVGRTEKLIDAALQRARGAALLRAIPDAVSGVVAAAVFLIALRSGAPGSEAAGALAAVTLMIQPMRDLAGVWDKYSGWQVARDKCRALLRLPKMPGAQQSRSAKLHNRPLSLRFRKVSAGRLAAFDATAEPGRKIAIIGPNGAGKSTILNLAAGLERPEVGQVRFGRRAATGLSSTERRKLITLIGTRSPILAGSLRRALTMGVATPPDDAEIIACATRFGLDHVIERLGGLGGQVAEAGRNLSAGEIRRLLLTRAALSNCSLMLLDEPDDALDQEGPALVERLVAASPATTLLITHNPAIAALMDEVWLVEDGRLIARGLPTEILPLWLDAPQPTAAAG